MLALEQAREQILAYIEPLGSEAVPLDVLSGRIAAKLVIAPFDLPLFTNSAMDGYAVRSIDLVGATASSPVALKLSGRVEAGRPASVTISPGHCARIFTGSVLPAGANAVVMQEDTRLAPETPGKVWILDQVNPGENVRPAGEDIKKGAEVIAPGEAINIGNIGMLAALGIASIQVAQRPVIGLLATGSELRQPGQPLMPGEIYESNRSLLCPLLERAGAVPKTFPTVADSLEATETALANAFEQSDSVITTGGVSVGELDLVQAAFKHLGGEVDFWKVAIKPGKPFLFGRLGNKFLFGLPGNPVSAFVSTLLLVRPAVRKWQGARLTDLSILPGTLIEPLVNPGDRRHFMRVYVDPEGRVRSAGGQGSHLLSSLARANGLLDLPPQSSHAKGATVQVLRWEV